MSADQPRSPSPPVQPSQTASDAPTGPGRRTVVGAVAAIGGAMLGAGAVGHHLGQRPDNQSDTGAGTTPEGTTAEYISLAAHDQHPYYGPHQAGITTPAQAHAVFLGLNLARGATGARVISLLRLLSDDAARLTSGQAPLGALEEDLAQLSANLTITFGFGPGLFAATGTSAHCPAVIAKFPTFATDELEPAWGQTDLLLQICGDEPTSVRYAQRRLLRDARTFTTVAWIQSGFANARGTEAPGTTARNLMGMRDGSANERDPEQLAQVVWNSGDTHPWLAGGSMLVLRRISIDMQAWDDIEPAAKQISFGRTLTQGAPLTGGDELSSIDRHALGEDGFPVIAPNAHAARAQARTAGERMLRRAYNYVDDTSPGEAQEGLLFAAYQADLATAFVPVQRRLAQADALNTWTRHIGSAVYAIPPGVASGSYPGSGLLEA